MKGEREGRERENKGEWRGKEGMCGNLWYTSDYKAAKATSTSHSII